jgi:hypothetical protein
MYVVRGCSVSMVLHAPHQCRWPCRGLANYTGGRPHGMRLVLPRLHLQPFVHWQHHISPSVLVTCYCPPPSGSPQ